MVPIKIDLSFCVSKKAEKEVISRIGEKPRDWKFGNVDMVQLPDSFEYMADEAIASLNASPAKNQGKVWSLVDRTIYKPEMPFGRGSIGMHTDEISGTTLLILLFCKPWVSGKSAPEYEGHSGEFLSGGNCISISQGGCIVFDDRKPHAWLTNSAWAFAAFPLNSYTK